MTTGTVLDRPAPHMSKPDRGVRVTFRQPVSTSGFIDAAWWPRSRDLTAELPPLLNLLWDAGREVVRLSYSLAAWDHAPRRIRVEGRTVRLGGFNTSDPLTVELADDWGRERIDVLVLDPNTDPSLAQRALLLASVAENPYRASEILARAADPTIGNDGEPR